MLDFSAEDHRFESEKGPNGKPCGHSTVNVYMVFNREGSVHGYQWGRFEEKKIVDHTSTVFQMTMSKTGYNFCKKLLRYCYVNLINLVRLF